MGRTILLEGGQLVFFLVTVKCRDPQSSFWFFFSALLFAKALAVGEKDLSPRLTGRGSALQLWGRLEAKGQRLWHVEFGEGTGERQVGRTVIG